MAEENDKSKIFTVDAKKKTHHNNVQVCLSNVRVEMWQRQTMKMNDRDKNARIDVMKKMYHMRMFRLVCLMLVFLDLA